MDYVINGEVPQRRENVVAGIVGAFLFSLAGAVIYFVLHLVGYIAAVSGLIGAVCAVKGYSLFAKKESKKGIIIAAVISLLVIVLAWYLCLSYDIYDVYKAWYEAGEIDFSVSFIDAVRATPEFLQEPDIAGEYLGDLGVSALFWLLGCGSYLFGKFKNANKQPAQTPDAPQ